MDVKGVYNYLREGTRLTDYDRRLDKDRFKLVAKMSNFEENISEDSTERLVDLYNRMVKTVKKLYCILKLYH